MRTCCRRALLVILGVCGLPLHATAQVGEPPGLVIDRTAIVERQVSVTVRNTSEQSITAWGVRGLVTYETGQPEKIEMYADGFATGFPDGTGSVRAFAPGETLSRLCGIVLRDIPVKSISLTGTALVFADGSSAGDEQVIQRVFDRRARDRRVLQTLESVLNQVEASTKSMDASAAIAEARARLLGVAEDVEIRESGFYRNIVDNLTLATRFHAQDANRLRAMFSSQVDDARRWRAAAEQHYQRR